MVQTRGMILALLCGTLWVGKSARAEGDEAKALDQKLAQQYQQGQARDRQNSGTTTKQDLANRAKEQAKKDVADYKESMLNNLASIKELAKQGDVAMKEERYDDAAKAYDSVSLANVPGSEGLAEEARGHLMDLEDMAKKKLHEAEDADIQRDYIKEADAFLYILKEFPQTKSKDRALSGITALRSRPEVAAFEEYKKAEDLEGANKLIDAVRIYESVSNNPRYEQAHCVAVLMAKRKLDTLGQSEQTRSAMKAELDARAAKEAPGMLTTARNYVANNLPKEAIRKLQEVMDKYPNTQFAEQAQKQLAELK